MRVEAEALKKMVERGIISPADIRNIEKHFMAEGPRKLTEKELKERKIAIKYGIYTGILKKTGEKAYGVSTPEWREGIKEYLKYLTEYLKRQKQK
jgi:hypothetical protein